MEVINKLKRSAYFVSIIYIIIGLIMLLNPIFVRNAINYIMGIFAILYGVIYIISLYQKKNSEVFSRFNLLGGILCVSFGLFLIVNPDVLFSLIPFCAGVIIFMDALTLIYQSISLKRLEVNKWWIYLIISLIFLGFSIYIIIHAKEISDLLIRIIGAFLIVDAGIDLIITYILSKKIDKMKVNDNNEITVIEHKEID